MLRANESIWFLSRSARNMHQCMPQNVYISPQISTTTKEVHGEWYAKNYGDS